MTILLPLSWPALLRADQWRPRAACSGLTSVFFDEDTTPARKVCRGCPVARECQMYSLDIEVEEGIWAGLDFEERVRLCPICLAVKPRPDCLSCCEEHDELRRDRLREQHDMGMLDVDVSKRQEASARTNPYCEVLRGRSHSSARAYKERCRCEPARIALRNERITRRVAGKDLADD